MMVCQPGSKMQCYDGTPGTAGIGECRMGMATCLGDGSGYGTCDGQVVNAASENCDTPLLDDNCDGSENENCPGQQLAIVAAAPPGYADDVRNYLMGTMKFMTIDVYDASVMNPTLADLQAHQSVLVFSDKVFFNPVALGDVLADYYDGGGRVVLAMFSTVGVGTRVQGRFGDTGAGYMITDPIEPLSMPKDDFMGTVFEPQSPLMRKVSAFAAISTFRSTGNPINGGVVVAQWDSGEPFIIRGTVKGRNRVDVNFYPPTIQMGLPHWTGDGAAILSNAVLF
jgi:hypothetical protein